MNRQQSLQRVRELSFMMDDIALFLDTNPNHQQALACYKKYRDMHAEAVSSYQAKYGPLTRCAADSDNRWTWLDRPWPWEKEAN